MLKKQPPYADYFQGKKIILMGLGLLGRGINVAKFLAESGAELVITDLKTEQELRPALRQLAKYKNIRYTLGRHDLVDFQSGDLVIRAANVPLHSPYLAEARKHNIPVKMDASLFMELAPEGVKFVGVTGTRGKSTVTQLIYEILKLAFRPAAAGSGPKKPSVFLGGNVRGLATLPLLKIVKPGDTVVMELDSWQLQGFGDAHLSPEVSVFTNLMLDHQNYYGGDPSRPDSIRAGMAQYFADKANIYRFQKREDFLITNQATDKLIKSRNFKQRGQKILVEAKDVPAKWKVKLLGEHNRYNIALAIATARTLGADDKVIQKVVEKFAGVPGRLEFIKEVKGVKYYNDTTATTPDGVIAALKALGNSKKPNIILLGGGADKELEFKDYVKYVNQYAKSLVLFKGKATDKIMATLPTKNKLPVIVVDSMKKALSLAVATATKGNIVLLSPGAASFGVFKNEYDRGDQFVALVKKLR